VLEAEVKKLIAAIKAKDVQIPKKLYELQRFVAEARELYANEIIVRVQPTTKK